MDNTDLRDRLARAEQDIKNHKENFQAFKSDDFGALKREVHTMRGELNEKIDKMIDMFSEFKDRQDEKIGAINLKMAYWSGGFATAFFVFQLALKKLGF